MNINIKLVKLKNQSNKSNKSNNSNNSNKSNKSNINFDKVKIIKILGSGLLGTTYLVNYQNKKYALKIQHILEQDKNKNFRVRIWREIDLYDYIKNLNLDDKEFFSNLYGYEIINNCLHKQIRENKIINENFFKELNALDTSPYCIKFLIEYKGDINLNSFLINNTLSIKLLYSICIQLCKIILILYKGGYSHNDIKPDNIMINKTKNKYFIFLDKQIPYEGYQISLIDYGAVLHKKYNMKYGGVRKQFLSHPEEWLFKELFYSIINIIFGDTKLINDCINKKIILPYERNENFHIEAIRLILINHYDFYKSIKDKYINKFPKGEELLNLFYTKITNTQLNQLNQLNQINQLNQLINQDKNKKYFKQIIDRIIIEFKVLYPKEYSKYFKWCSYYECILPKNIMQEILLFNNTIDLINYFINKLV